jgi:hypothetical protein
VSGSNFDEDRQPRKTIQRVVEAARHGQARLTAYRKEGSALGAWLRSHLFRQGVKGQQTKLGHSLRRAMIDRRLRQRQAVHRSSSGYSSTALYALQRASQAVYRKKR